MKIFDVATATNRERFFSVDGFPWLELEDMRSSDPTAPFDGGWPTPEFIIYREPLPGDGIDRYLPSLVSHDASRYLILRDQAIDSLSGLLEPYGELLPLSCDEAKMMIWWPQVVVDCLNDAKSDNGNLLWAPTGKKVLGLDFPVFRPELVPQTGAFILPQPKYPNLVFFTEELVEKMLATGDTVGVHFRKMWDSEKPDCSSFFS
ncbi:hypothetical protein KEM60_03275 [Austwickia sp. TVS 96-490-7B]|uniref:hypothetical protein n=1 Tax=Austwickia sp. TVS 96-490-7B TaxID=2830843 RepID=UPI001C55DE64|nr:hypothetical protein [Austwickia sp. TVS 96-490-7B]MBW3087045.1 hypothetical protein [Austwickia sp. TVS 96-490-7B]